MIPRSLAFTQINIITAFTVESQVSKKREVESDNGKESNNNEISQWNY
ncbi:hypothetical protein [Natranaerovirga pectinivora]|nr:hypothetical protein [Natranaerovirga pectinivora]